MNTVRLVILVVAIPLAIMETRRKWRTESLLRSVPWMPLALILLAVPKPPEDFQSSLWFAFPILGGVCAVVGFLVEFVEVKFGSER